jgi:tRNA pseudouridine-54 N-methylase
MTVYIFVDARSLANFIDDVHNVLCATHSESLMLSRKMRRSVNLFLVISYNTTFNRIRIRNHIHLQRDRATR